MTLLPGKPVGFLDYTEQIAMMLWTVARQGSIPVLTQHGLSSPGLTFHPWGQIKRKCKVGTSLSERFGATRMFFISISSLIMCVVKWDQLWKGDIFPSKFPEADSFYYTACLQMLELSELWHTADPWDPQGCCSVLIPTMEVVETG